MKYKVKYTNRTLCVEAENYNESMRQAKANRRVGEQIIKITWIASSVFDDLTKIITTNPIL